MEWGLGLREPFEWEFSIYKGRLKYACKEGRRETAGERERGSFESCMPELLRFKEQLGLGQRE